MLQKQWTILNGLKIRYNEYGQENTRHILFIHGLGSSADRWLDIPDALSENLHIITLDLPGFGKSDKPRTMDYTIENFRDIIIDFINKIGINDDKISIVGHSLGGFIAAEVAMKKKDLIEKLVLIDSSGLLENPTPLLEEYLQAAMSPTKDRVRKVFQQMVANPTRITSKLIDDFIVRINLPNAKNSFKSTLENSTNTQINPERLKQIDTIPTLIIWGIKDKVIPLEHSARFKEFMANSHVEIIPDAGHAPFAEKPDRVCEILSKFFT